MAVAVRQTAPGASRCVAPRRSPGGEEGGLDEAPRHGPEPAGSWLGAACRTVVRPCGEALRPSAGRLYRPAPVLLADCGRHADGALVVAQRSLPGAGAPRLEIAPGGGVRGPIPRRAKRFRSALVLLLPAAVMLVVATRFDKLALLDPGARRSGVAMVPDPWLLLPAWWLCWLGLLMPVLWPGEKTVEGTRSGARVAPPARRPGLCGGQSRTVDLPAAVCLSRFAADSWSGAWCRRSSPALAPGRPSRRRA